jgi:Protein of unknown function (DUF2975)
MKRSFLSDNVLMIIGAAAIISSIWIGMQSPDHERRFDLYSGRFDSGHNSLTGEYTRIRDSVEGVIECQEKQLSNPGRSQVLGTVGITRIQPSVICDDPQKIRDPEIKNSYYLALAGYKISKGSGFFLDGNKYMITSGSYRKSGDSYGDYVTKEIPVRYVKSPLGFQNSQSGYVLVPIAERVYHVLYVAMIVLGVLVYSLVFYFVIVRTLRIILDISKGHIFSHQNTKDLAVAGRLIMALAIIPLFLQFIFYNVYSKEIPAQITPAFAQVLWENRIYFIIGFIMLLLAKAFARGHRLQKENLSII